MHCDAEILIGPQQVYSPRKREELLKQFPTAIVVKAEGQGGC